MSPEQVAAAHLAAGRAHEALAAIEAAARAPGVARVLARHAGVLKALERMDECLAVRRLAAQRFPGSGVAWHNLASALADTGAAAQAAEACRKAFAVGLDAHHHRLRRRPGLTPLSLTTDFRQGRRVSWRSRCGQF